MFASVLRLRSASSKAFHRYFQDNDFLEIHTPILTTNDCEGAGEIFQVMDKRGKDSEGLQYFKSPVHLTVSGQLHLEVLASAISKVYTFGPTFRADSSHGRHHLAEFYMIEAEQAFLTETEHLCQIIEDGLKFVTHETLSNHNEDFQHLLQLTGNHEEHLESVEKLIHKSFIRLSYSDALRILEQNSDNFQFKPKWGSDLQKEHEKYLVEYCQNYPVFVYDFPSTIKPFYARVNEDNATVAAVDLLLPGVGEVCGGSLREERVDMLEERVKTVGIARESLQWYFDLRQFGSCPHGGFGIGFERYLQFLLGISNIKDVIPFPRTYHSCKL